MGTFGGLSLRVCVCLWLDVSTRSHCHSFSVTQIYGDILLGFIWRRGVGHLSEVKINTIPQYIICLGRSKYVYCSGYVFSIDKSLFLAGS